MQKAIAYFDDRPYIIYEIGHLGKLIRDLTTAYNNYLLTNDIIIKDEEGNQLAVIAKGRYGDECLTDSKEGKESVTVYVDEYGYLIGQYPP